MFRQCFYIPSGLPLHASTSVGFPLCLSFARKVLFVHAGLLTFAFLLWYALRLSLEVVILEYQPIFLNFFFLFISYLSSFKQIPEEVKVCFVFSVETLKYPYILPFAI